MTDHLYVWLDLETTGLDHEFDEIIEIGVIFTDQNLTEEDWEGSWLIGPTTAGWYRMATTEVVRSMHQQSGLLPELAYGDVKTLRDVETEILSWIDEWAYERGEGEPRVILAGNNVDRFDWRFLARDMPTLALRFHHHGHDVGSTMASCRAEGIDVPWKPATAHRALDDARAALEAERAARRAIRIRRGVTPEIRDAVTRHVAKVFGVDEIDITADLYRLDRFTSLYDGTAPPRRPGLEFWYQIDGPALEVLADDENDSPAALARLVKAGHPVEYAFQASDIWLPIPHELTWNEARFRAALSAGTRFRAFPIPNQPTSRSHET